MRRSAVGLGAAVGLLAGGLVGGGGWVYSSQLLPTAPRDETPDIQAVLNGDRVQLPASVRACLPTVGLRVPGAFLQLHGPVEVCDGLVTRQARTLRGDPPTGRVPARLDQYAYPADPASVGLSVEEITVPGPLGDYPAWWAPGVRDTWIVFVHGRGANRGEALRLLSVTAGAGYPGLVITYRNDGEAPPTADGVGRFGVTEWEDLAAAVDHARREGAARTVLVGYSQGASLVAFYLRRTPRVEGHVPGAILDAPLLSLNATLRQQARLRGLPGPAVPPILLGTALWSRLRAGFDPAAVEHVSAAAELPGGVPLLVFHGTQDDFVPVEPTRALAATRPDVVDFLEIPDADHVGSWNADPRGYATRVLRFLEEVTAEPAPRRSGNGPGR